MKRSYNCYIYLIHIVTPFLVGCLIYAIGRPLSFIKIGEQLKIDNKAVLIPLPEWVKYNLPDGLWLYSFLTWLILMWCSQKSREAFIWYGVLIAIAFGSELLQKFSLVNGTFDTHDMIAYCIALFLCAYNYYLQNTIPK